MSSTERSKEEEGTASPKDQARPEAEGKTPTSQPTKTPQQQPINLSQQLPQHPQQPQIKDEAKLADDDRSIDLNMDERGNGRPEGTATGNDTCRHWVKGTCRLGDNCNFRHPEQQAQPTGDIKKKPKKWCRFAFRGRCPFGPKGGACVYTHIEEWAALPTKERELMGMPSMLVACAENMRRDLISAINEAMSAGTIDPKEAWVYMNNECHIFTKSHTTTCHEVADILANQAREDLAHIARTDNYVRALQWLLQRCQQFFVPASQSSVTGPMHHHHHHHHHHHPPSPQRSHWNSNRERDDWSHSRLPRKDYGVSNMMDMQDDIYMPDHMLGYPPRAWRGGWADETHHMYDTFNRRGWGGGKGYGHHGYPMSHAMHREKYSPSMHHDMHHLHHHHRHHHHAYDAYEEMHRGAWEEDRAWDMGMDHEPGPNGQGPPPLVAAPHHPHHHHHGPASPHMYHHHPHHPYHLHQPYYHRPHHHHHHGHHHHHHHHHSHHHHHHHHHMAHHRDHREMHRGEEGEKGGKRGGLGVVGKRGGHAEMEHGSRKSMLEQIGSTRMPAGSNQPKSRKEDYAEGQEAPSGQGGGDDGLDFIDMLLQDKEPWNTSKWSPPAREGTPPTEGKGMLFDTLNN